MVSSAGKISHLSAPVQPKTAGQAFFRKAGHESFFRVQEASKFFNPAIQKKLTVSNPDDPQEKEADTVADKVMRMEEPAPAVAPHAAEPELADRKEEKKEAQPKSEPPEISLQRDEGKPGELQPKSYYKLNRSKDPVADSSPIHSGADEGTTPALATKTSLLHDSHLVQRSGRGPPAETPQFEQDLSSSKGKGSAMPENTRQFMGSRFNADFSGVRIHTGTYAENLSSSIHAQAFTHGNDIYFNTGKYSPNTSEGGTLLAHELTHTIQQGASKSEAPQNNTAVSPKSASLHRATGAGPSPLNSSIPSDRDEAPSIQKAHPANDGPGALRESGKETFNIDRKEEHPIDVTQNTDRGAAIQSHVELSDWHVNAAGNLQTIARPPATGTSGTVHLKEENPANSPEFDIDRKKEDAAEKNKDTAEEIRLQPKVEKTVSEKAAVDVIAPVKPAAVLPLTTIPCKEEIKEDSKENEEKTEASAELLPLHKKTLGGLQRKNQSVFPATSHSLNSYSIQPKTEFHDNSLNHQTSEPAVAMTNEKDRGPPSVKPMAKARELTIQRSWLGDAWDSVSGFVGEAAAVIARGLEAAKDWILARIRSFVQNIPGYNILALILGHDPITHERVDRSGRNILLAGLQLIPGGALFRQVLERIDAINQAAAWIDGRISDLLSLVSSIGDRFSHFMRRLSLSDIGNPEGVLNRVAELFRGIFNDVTGFMVRAAGEFLEMIKRIMLRLIVDFVRARIPRLYPLLRVALGHDPVTGEEVPRNGRNILYAALDATDEGREQRRQMEETGSFDRVAAWIDRAIAVFSTAYDLLRQAFTNLWSRVTIESLVSPIETFTRIYNDFAAPVRLVGNFLRDLALAIVRLIKDALLRRLRDYARTVRGYFLLTVILGMDPFTRENVPRSIPNIIHGFMSLMEGGEEQYRQMEESGAIARTTQRIEAAVARLNMTPAAIIQLFIDLWNSFGLRDLAHPIEAFMRIVRTFGEPIGRLIEFVIEIVKIVVHVILEIMNFPFDLINNIITRAMAAFDRIKRDPIGFLKNLLRAIKQGFVQFFSHIATHLLNGLTGWLMSELRDANVPAPTDFSLRGIIGWVLQVLGISMEAIWAKLAAHRRIGPERVARIRGMIDRLEGIWTFIKDVRERGMAAIWDKIQEQLSNLWNTVLDAIKNWVMERIISQVTARLLSMLDPTGIMAVINSAIAIFRAIQSFIRYLRQMLEVINSFVNGVADIAEGNVTTAANYLENTMDRAMPIVIGFLANQVGLSGIGRRIAEMITVVRGLVDRALTWLVNRVVDTGFALIERAMVMGRAAVSAITGWVRRLLGLEKRFEGEDGVQHRLYFSEQGNNVVLMINPTTPAGPFEVWVNSVRPDTSTPTGVQRAQKKTEAIAKAREIDRKKSEPTTGMTDAQERENTIVVRRMLDELSVLTGPLFTGMRPLCAIDGNGLEFGSSLQAGMYGKSMTARFLTNNRMPDGSVPNVSEYPSYRTINRRRYLGGSFYVKGHLLNHNLGGTGRDWKNLTPLTGIANDVHESTVEARVKNAVNAGNIVSYSVRAVYGRSRATSTDPEIQEIMNEEVNVPMRLICQADVVTLRADGRTVASSAPLVPADTVVENNIDGPYTLTAIRRAPVYLHSRNVTAIGSIPGVDPSFAAKIAEAVKQKMRRPPDRSRFATFNALRDFVFDDNSRFNSAERTVINDMSSSSSMNFVHLYEV